MNKQDLVTKYQALPNGEKYKVTADALDFLRGRGVQVSRVSLHKWRNNEINSPLNNLYRQAYQFAFNLLAANQAAAL